MVDPVSNRRREFPPFRNSAETRQKLTKPLGQVTSLPPLIGYGTAQTLIGFAYGVYPGFFISAGSCLVGGVFAFLVVRRLVHLFAPFIHKDKTFRALSNAVKVKGTLS